LELEDCSCANVGIAAWIREIVITVWVGYDF